MQVFFKVFSLSSCLFLSVRFILLLSVGWSVDSKFSSIKSRRQQTRNDEIKANFTVGRAAVVVVIEIIHMSSFFTMKIVTATIANRKERCWIMRSVRFFVVSFFRFRNAFTFFSLFLLRCAVSKSFACVCVRLT